MHAPAERGQVLVIVALALVVLLGAAPALADSNDLTLDRLVTRPTAGGFAEADAGVMRNYTSLMSELGVVMSPLYLMTDARALLLAGALLVGFGAHGMWGAFPSYITERFPSDVRGAGAGFCYHAGALAGSFTSFGIGHLVDSGWNLASAMTLSIAVSGLAVSALIWLGPETRGRRFQ